MHVLLISGLLSAAQASTLACNESSWPLWEDFKVGFIASDGRVLESISKYQNTFSEGQSYAMFFALVANDPVTFEKLWRWSQNNLFGGDPSHQLPAWIWGRAEDGSWKVLDTNSASDADLWFTYALLEAGRIWKREDYTRDARQLLGNIEKQEVVDIPDLGKMLLPGFFSYVQPDNIWRLNPSYLPIPILRRLAAESPNGPWSSMPKLTARMLQALSPKGFVADWISYQATPGQPSSFIVDRVNGARGSYDAIRVYLWAGMMPQGDPLSRSVIQSLKGMVAAISPLGIPPEQVNVMTGETRGVAPFGFSAALLPYLKVNGEQDLLKQQLARTHAKQQETLTPEYLKKQRLPYYDYMLTLFGVGWIEDRYKFLTNGQVQFLWEKTCRHANTR